MAEQRYDEFLKARDEDSTSVKMVTEATKAILQYVKNFAEGLNELSEEIRFLMERVERLERGIGVKTKGKRKKQKNKGSFSLPPLPSVSYGEEENIAGPVDFSMNNYDAPRGEPEDLKSELRSVLAEGIKLKPINEGKREAYHEIRSAAQDDFRRNNIPEKVFAPPPIESKKEMKKKEKKKKADDKATAKFRQALARDLENAFGK
jgi:hypothetical protein